MKIIFDEAADKSLNNLICEVCDFVMKTSEDYKAHKQYNCCYRCYQRWIDGKEKDLPKNFDLSKNLPSKSDLEKHKEKINNVRIKLL